MGRCRYVIKELVSSRDPIKTENTLLDSPESRFGSHAIIKKQPEMGLHSDNSENSNINNNEGQRKKTCDKQCRICLQDDDTPNNRLIESPCLCTGSVNILHINCLKCWLKNKVYEKHTEFGVTYKWKEFECDICKAKYPGKNLQHNRSCSNIWRRI